MTALLAAVIRFTRIGKLFDLIDGYKTYAAGFSMIFTGLGLMFASAATLAGQFGALTGLAADLAWLQGLKHDSNAIEFMAGWGSFLLGVQTVGQRHAQQKALELQKTAIASTEAGVLKAASIELLTKDGVIGQPAASTASIKGPDEAVRG
jgi:hypothetical protein